LNALFRYLSGCGVQPLFAPLVYNAFEELVFSTAQLDLTVAVFCPFVLAIEAVEVHLLLIEGQCLYFERVALRAFLVEFWYFRRKVVDQYFLEKERGFRC